MPERVMNLQALHPLEVFYQEAGTPLPAIKVIGGDHVPEPYKSLLVHVNDMTPTLEKFHGGPVHLKVLGSRRSGNLYSREVLLLLDSTDEVVEFGAINIHLEKFEEAAREEILRERVPVGHILAQYKVVHTSCPGAFLKIVSDETIDDLFEMEGPQTLYGRRNTLLNPAGEALAEIIEILPVAK